MPRIQNIAEAALRGLAVGVRGVLEGKRMQREAKDAREKRIADEFYRTKALALEERKVDFRNAIDEEEVDLDKAKLAHQKELDAIVKEKTEYETALRDDFAAEDENINTLWQAYNTATDEDEKVGIKSKIDTGRRRLIRIANRIGIQLTDVSEAEAAEIKAKTAETEAGAAETEDQRSEQVKAVMAIVEMQDWSPEIQDALNEGITAIVDDDTLSAEERTKADDLKDLIAVIRDSTEIPDENRDGLIADAIRSEVGALVKARLAAETGGRAETLSEPYRTAFRFVTRSEVSEDDIEGYLKSIHELIAKGEKDDARAFIADLATDDADATEVNTFIVREELLEVLEKLCAGSQLLKANQTGTAWTPELLQDAQRFFGSTDLSTEELNTQLQSGVERYRQLIASEDFTETERAGYEAIFSAASGVEDVNTAILQSLSESISRNQELFYRHYLGATDAEAFDPALLTDIVSVIGVENSEE